MKNIAKVVIALALVTALGACDLLDLFMGGGDDPQPLTASERLAAFIEDANATERVASVLRGNFHEDTDEYSTMGSLSYWETTTFDEGSAPFSITNATAAEAFTGTIGNDTYETADGALQLSADLTLGGVSTTAYDMTVVFLPNPELEGDYLIRKIEVDIAGTISEIKSIY